VILSNRFSSQKSGTQLAIQEMKKNTKGGVIINTSSSAGIFPNPMTPVYAATKSAVVNLTRSLADLYESHNIRVCAICPSFAATPLVAKYDAQVQKHMEFLVGRIMTTDEVIEGFLELTFDSQKQ
jgi:NAD(P)-dependent dehydrogenase (short-subunit alcohol dehydrogenase family)